MFYRNLKTLWTRSETAFPQEINIFRHNYLNGFYKKDQSGPESE